jgi:integrase
MTVACTNTLARCAGEKSPDGRTSARAEAAGQQLPLPFSNWRPADEDTCTREPQENLPAASIKELQSPAVAATLLDATAIRRRGPALSRRIGQKGSVFQHSQKWDPAGKTYGRFWVDVPSRRRQRRTIALGVCRTPSIAKQKLREYIETTGINSKQTFTSTTAPATTLRLQAEKWIASLSTRRRKPVKPATISGWQHSLDKWVLPNLGDLLLADVGNAALKGLIDKMSCAGLSPQTIVTHSKVVKMVVASAVNGEGEEIHPRKLNHNFVGMPIVDPTKQHRPTITQAKLQEIRAAINPRYAVLVDLLAGTGLRIGEALGLKTDDLTSECRMFHVRRSIWHGREQAPKTENAVRVIDVPEQLAQVLRVYVAGKEGYLFSTRNGTPLSSRNVHRALYAAGATCGFHSFRRYRAAVLRKAQVPEDLIGLWLGHARSLTDRYATQLREDVAYRSEWCERAGLCFQLGYVGLQNVVPIDSDKVA